MEDWQELLPEEIREWAFTSIEDEIVRNGDDYCDNYRCAEVGDPDQEQRFSEIERSGCCGSHRFEKVGPDGLNYVLGYNHGH